MVLDTRLTIVPDPFEQDSMIAAAVVNAQVLEEVQLPTQVEQTFETGPLMDQIEALLRYPLMEHDPRRQQLDDVFGQLAARCQEINTYLTYNLLELGSVIVRGDIKNLAHIYGYEHMFDLFTRGLHVPKEVVHLATERWKAWRHMRDIGFTIEDVSRVTMTHAQALQHEEAKATLYYTEIEKQQLAELAESTGVPNLTKKKLSPEQLAELEQRTTVLFTEQMHDVVENILAKSEEGLLPDIRPQGEVKKLEITLHVKYRDGKLLWEKGEAFCTDSHAQTLLKNGYILKFVIEGSSVESSVSDLGKYIQSCPDLTFDAILSYGDDDESF